MRSTRYGGDSPDERRGVGQAGQKPVCSRARRCTVSYVPKDWVPAQRPKCTSSRGSTPPPVKVVKVAPAWRVVRGKAAAGAGAGISRKFLGPGKSSTFEYKREGNILRVSSNGPGRDRSEERLGVVTLSARQAAGASGANLGTALGIDPISVSSQSAHAGFVQKDIEFANTAPEAVEQGELEVTLVEEGKLRAGERQIYRVWPYAPQYDPVSGLWFAGHRAEARRERRAAAARLLPAPRRRPLSALHGTRCLLAGLAGLAGHLCSAGGRPGGLRRTGRRSDRSERLRPRLPRLEAGAQDHERPRDSRRRSPGKAPQHPARGRQPCDVHDGRRDPGTVAGGLQR